MIKKKRKKHSTVININKAEANVPLIVNIYGEGDDIEEETIMEEAGKAPIEKLVFSEEPPSGASHLQEEVYQIDAFSCDLIEKREGLLTEDDRKEISITLNEVLISCRGLKKEKLKELWKSYGLGFLKKSVEGMRKDAREGKLDVMKVFDSIPPETSDFGLRNIVVIGKIYKTVRVAMDQDCCLTWKESDPSIIIQYPFFFEAGVPKNEIIEKRHKVFKFQKPSLNEDDFKSESWFLSKGFVKKFGKEPEIVYNLSLENQNFSSEKWTFECGNDIQLEKIDSLIEDKQVKVEEVDPLLKAFQSYCISKVVLEKRFVYGPVLIPDEVDAHGDIVSADEIQKAAWDFLEESGTTSFMHTTGKTVEGIRHQVERAIQEGYTLDELINGVKQDPLVSGIKDVLAKPMTFSDKIKIRETYLAPVDFKLGNRQVKKGTWIMGMHIISDLLWEGVTTGKITGFSIEGQSQRIAE